MIDLPSVLGGEGILAGINSFVYMTKFVSIADLFSIITNASTGCPIRLFTPNSSISLLRIISFSLIKIILRPQ